MQGFLETGSGKEVFELGIDFVAMSQVPVGDFFADLDELGEVSLRIPIPRFRVGDDGETCFQDCREIGVVYGLNGLASASIPLYRLGVGGLIMRERN